jgi:UDP-arabinose 4-epimerase
MNILLTGGAGYIGSHTAFVLRQAGYIPVVLDNLSHGHEWAVQYGPLIRGDVGDAEVVRSVCTTYQPVALIHFAAFIEVAESVADPDKYIENNFQKAARLFDTALACGLTHVVFSSTAAVYGTPRDALPLREEHPLRPINPYGESKLAAEQYLRSLAPKGMRSVALRYFNAAGAAPVSERLGEAHNPESHLIPNILLAGLGQKTNIKVFGTDYPTPDGTAIRDYIHVLDLAAAHVAALRYLIAGGATDAYNLGTGRGASVHEVIETVESALGHAVAKIYSERRVGDPPRLVAEATRAKERLGWTPQATLDEIVASALVWHRSDRYQQTVIHSEEC